MFFKLKDLTYDLGDTPIENIFINDFMPNADGDFVKVYLIGYKLAKESHGIISYDSNNIADILGLLDSDVIKAWNYWEECGIINKIYEKDDDDNFSVEFVNLKELYIKNVYTNNLVEKKDMNSVLDDPKIADMLTKTEKILGNMSINQKKDMAMWRDIYNMPTEIILEAVNHSVKDKNVKSLKYIEGIVRNWSEDNVRTYEALEENYKKSNRDYYRYLKIKRLIGLEYNGYSEVEYEKVKEWFTKYSEDLIYAACEKTINVKNPSIGYVNKILENWKDKGISEVSEIEEKDKKTQNRKNNTQNKNKFHNFKQLSDDYEEGYLESLAKKKRDELYRRLRNR